MVTGRDIISTKYAVESQYTHGAFGMAYYVDPVNGLAANDGLTPLTGKATFAQAHALATDNNDDVIYFIAGEPAGQTFLDEKITITKENLRVRGPGSNFIIKPTTAGDVITISGNADGIELSGFQIHSDGVLAGTGGINAQTSHLRIANLLIKNMTTFGIKTSDCHDTYARNIVIKDCDTSGIEIHNCTHFDVGDSDVYNCIDGFKITSDGVDPANGRTRLQSFFIDNCTTGLNIGTNVNSIMVANTVKFGAGNGTAITDNGTDSYFEQSAEDNTLVDLVWDEPLTGATHNLVTSAGKRLREVQEFVALDGHVHIDTVNGTAGTDLPIGTAQSPVDNITDARTIADANNISSYHLINDITLNAAHVGWNFLNDDGVVTVNIGGFDVNDSRFTNVTINGASNGAIIADGCKLSSVTELDGIFLNCELVGTNVLATSSSLVFTHCFSGVAGIGAPVLDCKAGVASSASIRAYSGGIDVRNFDQVGDNMTIELIAGQIILASTCTNGTIACRGIGKLTDNSTGTTVNVDGFIDGRDINTIKKRTSLIPATV